MVINALRQRRLEVIQEHMDTEVTHDFARTLETFDGHPHYESMATGQVFDGDHEVMSYYRTTRTAFLRPAARQRPLPRRRRRGDRRVRSAGHQSW